METPKESSPKHDPTQITEQVEGAHQILTALQEKMGEHPELGAAITKLEMALNLLAVKTGGVL
jgi:hypothetical protein